MTRAEQLGKHTCIGWAVGQGQDFAFAAWDQFVALEYINIGNNTQITGQLPVAWGESMLQLQVLRIAGLQLTGGLPEGNRLAHTAFAPASCLPAGNAHSCYDNALLS